MNNLYVTSWERGGGKTALCAGIGRHLQGKGKKVGYLKPVALTTVEASSGIDKDAQFVHQALELKEPVEALFPFCFTPQALRAELAGGNFPHKLLQACNVVSKDKDIVLLEGLGIDDEFLQASYQMADILDAKVIVAIPYSTDLKWERIPLFMRKFAQRLLGIVISRVPQGKTESIRTVVIPLFHKEGIKVLGILPEERLLLGVSVAQLAERLQAEGLCCPQASSALVENLMVGG